MKTNDIIEWAVVDDHGTTFAYRKTRKEIRALLKRFDPTGSLGYRVAKVVVAK